MDSPFIPGAKVALVSQAGGWHSPQIFIEGTVAKTHKNGNFVLEGSPQQWRPYAPSSYENFWRAGATGNSSRILRIWDETTSEEIERKNARAACFTRFKNAQSIIERAVFCDAITDEIASKLTEVAADISPKKGETP